MAKSESTAVNELISLVQGGSPTRDEPTDDLFGPPKGRMAPPRMTSTVPPLRGAGDVAPLPPQRAPTGTSQLVVNKPVRMMTAPPTRSTTIPPLPQARAAQPAQGRPAQARKTPQAQPAQPRKTPQAQPAQPRPTPQAQPAQAAPTTLPPLPAARASTPPPPAARASTPPSPAARASTPPSPAARASSPPPPRSTASTDHRPALPRPTAPRATAAQPAQARGTGAQPAQARGTGAQRTAPPATTPVAAPFDAGERPAIDKTGDAVSADNWFEASRMVEKVDETWVGTRTAPKRRDPGAVIRKIMLPLVVLSVVSAGVAYVVFSHHAKKLPPVTHVAAPVAKAAPVATAPTAAAPSMESANAATATAGGTQPEPPAPGAAPAADQIAAHPNANEVKIVAKGDLPAAPATNEVAAPPAAPEQIAAAPAAPAAEVPAAPVPAAKVAAIADASAVVHEVPTAHGVVKLVDVRIDSKPAGATVMLVDSGKTSFLGTTPVAASVEPTRSYDVVLTLEGRPTQIAHLDPTKAQRLEITLAKGGAKAETPRAHLDAPKSESPKSPKAARHHVATSAPAGGLVDPGPRQSGRDSLSTAGIDAPAAPKTAAGGEGTLMVSSKPPCEIWIDGKDTGLTTPQRSISLSAGSHKVTFSNPDANITKTVSVKIAADQSTKLIQNLMAN